MALSARRNSVSSLLHKSNLFLLIFKSAKLCTFLTSYHYLPTSSLGVDHLIFDGGGGVQIPPKNIEHMFLVKKNVLQNSYEGKKNRAAL